MKNYFWTLFLVLVLSVSCNKEDDTQPTALTIDENAIPGDWRLIKYIDDGIDDTNEFPSSTIIQLYSNKDVFFPGTQIFGSWGISDNNKRLIITVNNGIEPYTELDDEWAVTKLDETSLWLLDADDIGDDDPDDTSIEEFHFEKVE